jgi:predicted glycosyltransferase
VLVPRAEPVMEQLMRARLLTSLGYFHLVEPDELTGPRLMASVLAALREPRKHPAEIALDGVSVVRNRVRRLLESAP